MDTSKPKEEWDGGCSRSFFTVVLKALSDLYGPRKVDLGAEELLRLSGPLGGVEYDYRMLDKPDPVPDVPEKVAGYIEKYPW